MDAKSAIRSRRNILKFTRKDPGEVPILSVLDAGRWAPSAGNRQPWEFVIVHEKETKEMLAGLYVEAYNKLAGELERGHTDERETAKKIYDMLPVLNDQLRTPPYIIVVVADPERSQSFIVDTAACIQNMLLQAWALRLGTAWIDLTSTNLARNFDLEKMKYILDIPDHIRVVAMIPIGFPEQVPAPPKRRPLKELIHKSYY